MRNRLLRMTLVIAALVALAACQKAPAEATAQAAAETGALTGVTELLVGTLQLEGTENEIDAATAAQLVPLWKAYRALMLSDTTVAVELEALEKQIRAAMSSAQVKAITAMHLTAEDMTTALQEHGGLGEMAADGTDTDQRQALRAAAGGTGGGGGGGGMPAGGGGGGGGGGMPAGGGDMPAGGAMVAGGDAAMLAGGMDPSAMAAMFEGNGTTAGAQTNRMLTPLIQVVITLLEGKG